MIIVRLKGGMGNQMFQYAAGRALSLKYNVPLKLDLSFLLDRTPRPDFTFRDYSLAIFNISAGIAGPEEIPFLFRPHFRGKLRIIFGRLAGLLCRHKGKEKSFRFDPLILQAGPKAYLDGYFQSPKYFAGIENTIRNDFTFIKAPGENIQSLKKEIEGKKSLCIHIRRGDFVGNPHHGSPDQSYYLAGIDYVKKNAGIEKIYVFSDDMEWCKKNLQFEFPAMFVGDEYAGEKASGHLLLMSSCRNFVISNSTFSWWAAWLRNSPDKIVVAPKKWFKNDSPDASDLMPPQWIRI
jgi:hypothetical protein